MRIISLKMLRDFSSLNPEAVSPLRGWRKTIEQNQFACWADLKRSLNSVDKVDDLTVFNVGGNERQ